MLIIFSAGDAIAPANKISALMSSLKHHMSWVPTGPQARTSKRNFKRWSKDENLLLVDLTARQAPYSEISKKIGRSERACRIHKKRILLKMYSRPRQACLYKVTGKE